VDTRRKERERSEKRKRFSPGNPNKRGTIAGLVLSSLATGARTTAKVVPHRSYFLPYFLDRFLSNSITGICGKLDMKLAFCVNLFCCLDVDIHELPCVSCPICCHSIRFPSPPFAPHRAPHMKCPYYVTTEYSNTSVFFLKSIPQCNRCFATRRVATSRLKTYVVNALILIIELIINDQFPD
jgi:hypothetical protein